jgi:hypothetical protein
MQSPSNNALQGLQEPHSILSRVVAQVARELPYLRLSFFQQALLLLIAVWPWLILWLFPAAEPTSGLAFLPIIVFVPVGYWMADRRCGGQAGTKSALALRYSYKPTYASLVGGFDVLKEKVRFAPNSGYPESISLTKDCSGLMLSALEWGDSFYKRAESR